MRRLVRALLPQTPPRATRRSFGGVRSFLGGVRVRLTVWYLAILAVVFVVFGGVVSATAIQQDQKVRHTELTVFWTQISSTYAASSGTLSATDPWDARPVATQSPGLPPAKPSVGKPLTDFGPYEFAVLLDADFVATQRFGPLTDRAVAQVAALALQHASPHPTVGDYPTVALAVAPLDGATDMLTYMLYDAPILSRGQVRATLVVGQPAQSTNTLSAHVPGLLIAGPLTLLVAALGGYWLAARALRPVRLITRAAEAIEGTDLSGRLNLSSGDELGELASTFDRMLGRLEAAFARQRRFTGDASHELRTPLAIVGAESERALDAPRSPDEYRRALAVIQDENARMTRLVEHLLLLARADAGQLRPRDEPLDLSDVALDAVERLAPRTRTRGVVLSAGSLPELRVHGDRTALGLAIGNLVENAIKYAGPLGASGVNESGMDGPGGGRVLVETAAADVVGGRAARVRVADDGPGIAAEHLPHLFERFYRVDTARAAEAIEPLACEEGSGGESVAAPEGSGLSLAIAHEIARAHGGAIRVESAMGSGTTFTFELPLG